MTDKEFRLQKKRIGTFLDKWQRPLGLRWWKLHITFDRSYSATPNRVAETNMNGWKYREAEITFFLPKVAEETDDDEVERLVVHELCHVLLSPISVNMEDLNNDYQQQLMEFNTDLVATAFLWVWEAGKDAKV